MLEVKTPDEVMEMIEVSFSPLTTVAEEINIEQSCGRILAADVCAEEYVPDFHRSTVDGYAVCVRDTFGCTDAIPAILTVKGEVLMGEDAGFSLQSGECAAIPTGGAVPEGADGVVMVEYTEDYGDGTVGILKPSAPGQNMIFRGDDVHPGKKILPAGRVLNSQDIGALAAIGVTKVSVRRRVKVGIISTGDELVPPDHQPGPGQIRDVNGPMLAAMLRGFGAEVISYGIVCDDEDRLREKTAAAAAECDMVLLSGGSSVGIKDAACRIIASYGELMLHGIAMKPGKPTIMGRSGNKPLIGLPGHPVAAWFITRIFVTRILAILQGREFHFPSVTARLSESISANHGRAQYMSCYLEEKEGICWAHPVRGKSGLITTLAGADGFFCIARDCEGLPEGAEIVVTRCSGE